MNVYFYFQKKLLNVKKEKVISKMNENLKQNVTIEILVFSAYKKKEQYWNKIETV